MERGGYVVLMCLILCMVGVIIPMAEGASPSECKREKNLLVDACKAVIYGHNPTPACCGRVRATHAECVCPYVTPKVANLINVDRTIKQIRGCGRNVPHNFKCGSITFP